MSDEVNKVRAKMQELREAHLTGFVDDRQFAEGRMVLERRLADALEQERQDKIEAQFAPTMLMSPAGPEPDLPSRSIEQAVPRSPWWLWLVAALLVHGLVLAIWWWPNRHAARESAVRTSADASVPVSLADRAWPSTGDSAVSVTTDEILKSGSAAAGPSGTLSGRVTLSAQVAGLARPNDTLFIFARAVDGTPMPLAVIRKQVKDLPVQFRLDDAMALWPDARISAYTRMTVTARVSKSGDGQARKGDLEGQSTIVSAGTADLLIDISRVVEN